MSLFRPSSSVSVWLITNQLTKKCSVYWLAMHTATQYYVTVFVSHTRQCSVDTETVDTEFTSQLKTEHCQCYQPMFIQ